MKKGRTSQYYEGSLMSQIEKLENKKIKLCWNQRIRFHLMKSKSSLRTTRSWTISSSIGMTAIVPRNGETYCDFPPVHFITTMNTGEYYI